MHLFLCFRKKANVFLPTLIYVLTSNPTVIEGYFEARKGLIPIPLQDRSFTSAE